LTRRLSRPVVATIPFIPRLKAVVFLSGFYKLSAQGTRAMCSPAVFAVLVF